MKHDAPTMYRVYSQEQEQSELYTPNSMSCLATLPSVVSLHLHELPQRNTEVHKPFIAIKVAPEVASSQELH